LEILDDDDMVALIRNNSPDVARGPYGREFRSKAVRAFKRGNQMQSAFLSDEELRERLITFMFGRALREALTTR
jgi:type I restriction enzyme R subunit